MAMAGAAGLIAAQSSSKSITMGMATKGIGFVLLGLHSGATLVNSAGEYLEGIGLGEHDWDGEKLLARTASPEYGEMIYSSYMAKGSIGGFVKSRKIMDAAGVAKDINDIDDALGKNKKDDGDKEYDINKDVKNNINNINVMQDIYMR